MTMMAKPNSRGSGPRFRVRAVHQRSTERWEVALPFLHNRALMEEPMRNLLVVLSCVLLSLSQANASDKKEWTFLIFLNGNNNLDRYGTLNLNQIEKVGSTDKINVVVQWASYSTGTVKRLYMTQ